LPKDTPELFFDFLAEAIFSSLYECTDCAA